MGASAPELLGRVATRGRPVQLSVVVPVYNEVSFVRTVMEQVSASPVEKEIIVVDDGSTDGTAEELENLTELFSFKLVRHRQNQGKGAAIRTALQHARGEFIIIQDADLEYDPQDFPRLLEPLVQGRANVVYGVRHDKPGRGLAFYLCAKWLTLLTNILYGVRIHDEATCYKVFRRSLLDGIELECTRFEFCPEVTAKICRLKEPIFEVPISYRPRRASAGKKIQLADAWEAMWTLARWRFRHFSPARPATLEPCCKSNRKGDSSAPDPA